MLKATVFSFSVLPDGYKVNSLVRRVYTLDRLARTHVGEQIEAFPQSYVKRPESLTNGSLEGSLQAVFIPALSEKYFLTASILSLEMRSPCSVCPRVWIWWY
jgi:hypothetical protein